MKTLILINILIKIPLVSEDQKYFFHNIMYLLHVSSISITDDVIQFIYVSPTFILYNVI